MLKSKNDIFILFGFLILWSLIISIITRLFTEYSLVIIFSFCFLGFGIFAYILIRIINITHSLQELENTEIIPEDKPNESIDRISVKTGSKVEVIQTKDIMFLQSNGDYVSIYSKDKVYLKEQTMKYFEENLNSKQFVRIHRTYIVNIDFIDSISSYKKSQFIITLKNNYELKASLSGYKILKETLSI